MAISSGAAATASTPPATQALTVTNSTITGSTGAGIVFGGNGSLTQTFIADNDDDLRAAGDALALNGFNGAGPGHRQQDDDRRRVDLAGDGLGLGDGARILNASGQ